MHRIQCKEYNAKNTMHRIQNNSYNAIHVIQCIYYNVYNIQIAIAARRNLAIFIVLSSQFTCKKSLVSNFFLSFSYSRLLAGQKINSSLSRKKLNYSLHGLCYQRYFVPLSQLMGKYLNQTQYKQSSILGFGFHSQAPANLKVPIIGVETKLFTLGQGKLHLRTSPPRQAGSRT